MNRIFAFLLAFSLAACATPGGQSNDVEIRKGVIEQITPTEITDNQRPGLGAIAGGAVGLGIGSLIGAGTGRDVAMVAGAIGGALAGNEIQKRHNQPIPAQEIIVRLGNGVLVAVTQPTNQNLRKGQHVYIEGNGEGARVVQQ